MLRYILVKKGGRKNCLEFESSFMTKTQLDLRYLLLYSISLLALIFYFYGFFPVNNVFRIPREDAITFGHDEKPHRKNGHFQKLVLIVIDALRFDFVSPSMGQTYMDFTTSSILENKSCLFKVRAQAPTVTMPRIKAMTSGMVPSFFDVVTNFMAGELITDNFIHQAKLHDLKIAFYGDETWLKLFPNTFYRYEGTNSFFASDYTEVDENVTRHLKEEFQRNDWDFLILHYLGLDHIGHIEGPKSALIKPKLNEMDAIILKIFKALMRFEEEGKKSLLIVTSDHGMRDSGGHGGMTPPEMILPLVSVGKPCQSLSGWPENYVAEQIDIASTVSAAFGLPIPKNNIGKLIPGLFHETKTEFIFQALELNRQQLRSLSYSVEPAALTTISSISRAESYFHELSDLSSSLQRVSEFRLSYITFGLVLMWSLLITSAIFGLQVAKPKKSFHYLFLFGLMATGISLGSTSLIEEEHQTWYFLWATFCILSILHTFRKEKRVQQSIPWLVIVFAHRVLRKLNQTGDKWAMLPDIKGYLNKSENQVWLILMCLVGFALLFWCATTSGCTKSQMITFAVTLLFSFCYRLKFLDLPSIAHVFWFLALVFAVQSAINRTPAYLVWSLVVSILLKPHNVILVPIEILSSREIHKLFAEDAFSNCVAHLWMGSVFYFYQGNGNSLANVDVAAGFVGLQEFRLLYSAAMIMAHTNCGHVLAFLLSPRSNLAASVFRLIPLTLFCTFLTFQLNHLFIWSVFSPKLLYETNLSLVFFFLMTFNCIVQYFSKKSPNEFPK